jgi:hypothetical protein
MKNISNNGEKRIHTTWNDSTVTQYEHFSCEILVFYSQNFVKKNWTWWINLGIIFEFSVRKLIKTKNTLNNETIEGLYHWQFWMKYIDCYNSLRNLHVKLRLALRLQHKVSSQIILLPRNNSSSRDLILCGWRQVLEVSLLALLVFLLLSSSSWLSFIFRSAAPFKSKYLKSDYSFHTFIWK